MNRFICKQCNKEFSSYKKIKPFCSLLCRNKSYIGRTPWNKGKKWEFMSILKKGKIPKCAGWNKGLVWSDEVKNKMSKIKIGKLPWNNGLIGYRKGIKHPWMKSGEKSSNWKGGISINHHSNTHPEYKEWRKLVFERDNYKCRIDNNCKGYLEAHHILSWRDYPELRYNINNGITLCHSHHPRKWGEEKRLAPVFQELVSVSN